MPPALATHVAALRYRPLLIAAAALGVLEILLLLGDPRAGLLLAVVTVAAYLVIRSVAPARWREDWLALFAGALALRVALALALQWIVPLTDLGQRLADADPRLAGSTQHLGTTIFWDEWMYEQVAWEIAQWWRNAGDLLARGQAIFLLPTVYLNEVGEAFGIQRGFAEMYLLPHVYLDALLYTVLGRDPLAARVLQSSIGAVFPLIVFALGRRWFGDAAGRVAGWVAAFEPSLVLWSPWLLKDTPVTLLIALVLLGVTLWAAWPRRSWPLLLMVAALGVLVPLRGPVATYLAILAPLGVLTARIRRRQAALLGGVLVVLLGFVLLVGGQGFLGTRWLNADLPFQIWYARVYSAQGARTATVEEVPGSDPLIQLGVPPERPAWVQEEATRRNVTQVPGAIVTVLTAPLPWQAQEARDRLALLTLPTWYLTLLFALVGLAVGTVRCARVILLPAGFLVATVLYLALTDSSVGIILRHRLMFYPVALPLAGYGVSLVFAWWRARRPGFVLAGAEESTA